MHDRRDRTSWAYQLPPNLAPPIPYAESSGVPACPTSSSHMLSSPLALIPPSYHHQHSQQRLSTNATNTTTLLPSFRCAPSNHEYRNEQECAHQHQRQHQEQLSHQVASLPPSFTMMSETWFGLVQTPRDAYLLLEACRVGKLHRITRRLTDLERSQIIRPGAVFVWEEKEAGIKRWTDHVRWSPSRVSGAFLVYSELLSAATRDSHTHVSDPLLKQSFSSTTLDGDRLHLIAYYSKSALDSRQLRTPTGDDNLRSIVVPTGVYPDHRATGGVEDQATRDRQRSSRLPRSSVGSFETSHSIPSSSSLESVTSSLDTPHLHPATPTQLGELSYHRPPLSGVSHLHTARSLSDTRGSSEFKYGHQPDYYSSFYPQSLAPSVTDRQTMPSDSTRWESFPPNLSTWEANTGTSAATSESVSYPSVTTTTPIASGLNSPNTSSISALGVWGDELDRDRTEKRISAPITHPLATHPSMLGSSNSHSYHPYARISDRERPYRDRRLEGKTTRGVSCDPATAPATPLDRIYALPSLHAKNNDSPPLASSNTPTPSTLAGVGEEIPQTSYT
ncbi:hypothetical protein PtA15_10A92 [Puccinia triticina]|uniref:cAMP-independent regulatory protein pac2 n=1 Tax=Puccinia triticina TaxID=208348 RepID=A0ABY7CTQ8_9BASI|nr:uncharacterized protein PtA15_10A92 [Puccinia triticina]WAQ88673.1 hypothetical protein PtA15_10A92 [Puccinia triticina]